jgi:chromosome segregation ATPase
MEDNTPPLASCEASSSRSAAALRELEERARSAVSAQRGQLIRLEEDITKQLDAIASAIGEERSLGATGAKAANEASAEIERLQKQAEDAHAACQLEQQEHEAKLASLRAELQTLTAKQSEQEQQAQTWTAEQAALRRERDGLLKKVADLEAKQHIAQKEWQEQLTDFERRLAEQQTSWNEQRDEWDKNRAALEHQRDELQQKFDLALGTCSGSAAVSPNWSRSLPGARRQLAPIPPSWSDCGPSATPWPSGSKSWRISPCRRPMPMLSSNMPICSADLKWPSKMSAS